MTGGLTESKSLSTSYASIIRLTNPKFTLFTVDVGDLEYNPDPTTLTPLPDAPQRAGTVPIPEPLNVADRRTFHAVWRNGNLYVTTVIAPQAGLDINQTTAHWFRFDTSATGKITLADQGDVGGEDIGYSVYTFYPSVAVDKYGNMAIGFGASGPFVHPGAYYAVRAATDPPGQIRDSRVLAAGLDSYEQLDQAGRNRWGDYSGMALDPSDEVTFWAYNEYALPEQGLGGRWGTRWGSFRLADAAPLPVSGPVTVTGVVWHDLDENRKRDLNEAGLSGWTIYADLDGDGERDLGEPSIKTDSQGKYSITATVTGTTLTIREAVKPGWRQTFPGEPALAQVLTLTGGGTIANVNFGNSDNDGFDHGDAPAPYPTLESANGPTHAILPGFGLGVAALDGSTVIVDGEPDGLPDSAALGDDNDNFDDENGVVFTTGLAPGKSATVTVTVSLGANAPGTLAGLDRLQPGRRLGGRRRAGIHEQDAGRGHACVDHQCAEHGHSRHDLRPLPLRTGENLSYVGPSSAGEVEDYRVDILSDKPVAVDDSYTVDQDSRDNVLRVLANDIPSSNGIANLRIRDPLSTAGSSGSAVIDRNGTPTDYTDDFIRYTPAPGATAPDAFSYTVEDMVSGATDTATVSITINQAAGNAPIAVDDSYLVPPPTVPTALLDVPTDPYLFNVLKNDRVGPTGAVTIPTNGLDTTGTVGTVVVQLVTLNNQTVQMVRYTPPSGFSGTDQFRYTIIDSNNATSVGTVTVQAGTDRTADDAVRFRLVTADMNGNPITSIGQGLQFQVLAYVQDMRDVSRISAAPELPAQRSGRVFRLHGSAVRLGHRGLCRSRDLLHRLQRGTFLRCRGARLAERNWCFPGNRLRNNFGDPYGPTERLLYKAVFTASALGTARFKSDPADVLPLHETALNVPPEFGRLPADRFWRDHDQCRRVSRFGANPLAGHGPPRQSIAEQPSRGGDRVLCQGLGRRHSHHDAPEPGGRVLGVPGHHLQLDVGNSRNRPHAGQSSRLRYHRRGLVRRPTATQGHQPQHGRDRGRSRHLPEGPVR